MSTDDTSLFATILRVSPLIPGTATLNPDFNNNWFTAEALHTPATLSEQLARVERNYPGAGPRTQGALVVNEYSYYLLAVPVATFLTEKRVPDLSPGNIALQWVTYTWEEGAASGEAERLDSRLLSEQFTSLQDDPLAAEKNVTTLADEPALRDHLRQQIETHFTPLIDAVHQQTRLSRGALWRLVADACALLFLNIGQKTGQTAAAQSEGLTLINAAKSAMRNPHTNYLSVVAAGQIKSFVARGGCCRYYTLPGKDKCATCVLRPTEEQKEKLTAYYEGLAAD